MRKSVKAITELVHKEKFALFLSILYEVEIAPARGIEVISANH